MIKKIRKQVQKKQNKIFYKNDYESITYKELWDKAFFYGDLLKREGDSPIIIYGDKEVFVVISIIACLIARRAYVPIATFTPIERLKTIVKQIKPSIIITEKNLNIEDVDSVTLEKLTKYDKVEYVNNFNEIAYIIFTSGSSGIPKGVPISYNNLNNFINWISNIKVLKDFKNINVLNQASFSFDLSVADFYYSICNGHTLIPFNDIDKVYDLIKNEEISLAIMTPTFMKLCLLNSQFNEVNYSTLKCVYFCGEQLEVQLVKKIYQRFPNITIINAYGPTEATSAVSAINITHNMLNYDLLPVGDVNNFATSIEITDDEIILSGESVFDGYVDRISDAVYKIDGINYYNTGDIGFIRDNMLFCKGRKDEQIKYKGYRIELNDVKFNIDSIKGVKDSVVLPKYRNNVVCGLIAYIIGEEILTVKYIRTELLNKIPNYMIPATIRIIDCIPVTKNGKVDKEALKNYD